MKEGKKDLQMDLFRSHSSPSNAQIAYSFLFNLPSLKWDRAGDRDVLIWTVAFFLCFMTSPLLFFFLLEIRERFQYFFERGRRRRTKCQYNAWLSGQYDFRTMNCSKFWSFSEKWMPWIDINSHNLPVCAAFIHARKPVHSENCRPTNSFSHALTTQKIVGLS